MKRIMLADDDATIRLLVNATLRGDEYELFEASDGEETLLRAREIHPDLILLDIGMPKIDGIEVCRVLKGNEATNDIKVIILTARAQEHDRQRAHDAGAEGYFTKPFSPLALLNRISQVLDGTPDS